MNVKVNVKLLWNFIQH